MSPKAPFTLNLEMVLVIVVAVLAMVGILGATFFSAQAPHEYQPATQIPLADLPPTGAPPGDDKDQDGLFDIDENYIYGTDTTKTDTDGDGMPDPWEVQYRDARNPDTRELLIDPVNPTDAYEDPDQDGYDYNNNGHIDTYQDSLVRTNLSIPSKAQYQAQSVCAIAQNQLALDGKLLHLDRVAVMDNGTFGDGGTNPSTEINIRVTDTTTTQTTGATVYTPQSDCQTLRVLMEPGSNRPASLLAWRKGTNDLWVEGADLINIEGIFHVDPTNLNSWWLTIRGGEGFPNIQEYQTWRVYDNSGKLNGSNPLVRDTDTDGMWDGFEAHYGKGHVEEANKTFLWVWDFFMSPVNTSDAGIDYEHPNLALIDPDGDGIDILWPELVRACLLRDANQTCLNEVPSQFTTTDFVRAGTNLHEFYIHTRPDRPDTDNDTYPPPAANQPIANWNTADMQEYLVLKTSPVLSDTDSDGMDDGWEVYYQLLPLNATDKFEDPDADLLPNINEYTNPGCRLHPRLNDTDQDLMPDGWEVTYFLDSCRNDASEDVDLTRSVVTPDGLTNIQEFYSGTNPRRVDTDGDFLNDFDEVTRAWPVQVEGKSYIYKTDPVRADTDLDDYSDDEDSDGNFGPCEEILDGVDNDGDARFLQNDGFDTDGDGQVDDGPFGRVPTAGPPGTSPETWTPEGVDEEHDLCDWNEVNIYHTNASNADTDLEGLADWIELFTDRNATKEGRQTTNPNLRDSDGDRLDDYSEVPHDVGGIMECLKIILPGFTSAIEKCTDPLNPDSDGDDLEDGLEVLTDFAPFMANGEPDPVVNSTDPTTRDTDRDGLSDGFEFDNSDLDGDGLPTRWELDRMGVFPLSYKEADADSNGVEDAREDWDADGVTNLAEYQLRMDPFDIDSDNDGEIDSDEQPGQFSIPRLPVYQDSDGDYMPDWWEKAMAFDAHARADGCAIDSDGDGFADLDEYLYNTDPRGQVQANVEDRYNHPFIANPRSCDGDADGIANWWEEYYGLNPNDPADADRNLDRELNATAERNQVTGILILADNWTNFEEYIFAAAPYARLSTNPAEGDSDLDAWVLKVRPDGSYNATGLRIDYDKFNLDHKDADPVVLWHSKRATNPSIGVAALSPIVPGDASGDIDRDGVNNTIEANKGTSAFDADSDGDGMPDGWEIQYAIGNATTGRPILDPLSADDANEDPDNDGWNYSRIKDENGYTIITRYDFNQDGILDQILDNEQFSNLEEYWFGDDVDGDGIIEQTTNPGKKETIPGLNDGFLMYFRDRDFDQLPRWFEAMFLFDDADPPGVRPGQVDSDQDEVWNVIEARSTPWTNPRDPLARPPECSWPREFLPDPNNPPAGWPC